MIIQHRTENDKNQAYYKYYPYGNENGEFLVNIGQTQAIRMSWLQGSQGRDGMIPIYRETEIETLIEEGKRNVLGLRRAVLGVTKMPTDQPQEGVQFAVATTSVNINGSEQPLWGVLAEIRAEVADINKKLNDR